MKKILVILFCLLFMGAIFANPFEINLGLIGQYNSTLESTLETQEFKLDFNDFNLGATADVKLSLAEINVTAFCTRIDEKNVLNGVLSGNLVLDLIYVRAGIGVGINYLFDTENGFRFVGGDFMDANLSLRGEVDVLIKDIRVGVYATVPTKFTFSNLTTFKYSDIELKDFWKAAVVGVALKVNIL